MRTRRQGRRTPVTRFLDEVLDSARELTDDTLDRMGDAERDVRRGIVRLMRVDGGGRRRSDRGRAGDRPARFERDWGHEKGGRILIAYDDDRPGRSDRDLRHEGDGDDRIMGYDDRQAVESEEARGSGTTGSTSGDGPASAAGGRSGV